MMPGIEAALIAAAILGHMATWIAMLNRLHGIGLPERIIMRSEKVVVGLMLGSLTMLVAVALRLEGVFVAPVLALHAAPALAFYFWLCFGMGVRVIAGWAWRHLRGDPRQFLACRREILHVEREIGKSPGTDRLTRHLGRLPGNQIFQLEVAEKTVQLPHLASQLEGLVVVHLSDLHLTGHMSREYYELLVSRTNAAKPDIVAMTGDIMDNPDCVPWIPEIFGKLEAPSGVYSILGNHEKRLDDIQPLLQAYEQAGIQHIGGGHVEVIVRGLPVLVAGNASPWFPPAPDLPLVPSREDCPEAIRLLLSHSPDRIVWARRRGFDLMLAGHTHGGQIRPPVVGPILGHSLYGLTYCAGIFYRKPTLLHVSRGACQTQPLRINCRPELVKLVLRAGRTDGGRSG